MKAYWGVDIELHAFLFSVRNFPVLFR